MKQSVVFGFQILQISEHRAAREDVHFAYHTRFSFLFMWSYSLPYGGADVRSYITFLPFFIITFCQFRWTRASFYRPWNFLMQTFGASLLDSIIFGISCTESASRLYSSRTKMLDKSGPTLTSPEKNEIIIFKKKFSWISHHLLYLYFYWRFSFSFQNLCRCR